MNGTLIRRAFVLGMLMAVGPFAIDMYLPGFPVIARDLGTDEGMVQLSLMVFFLALAFGQLIYGPLSDRIGRKAPIHAGILLFVLASIGCAYAPDIETLLLFRFLQGLGGCAGTVITLAVIRDLHSGAEATRLLSLALLALSLSPLLAPVMGGILIELASWRLIFWVLAGLGVLIAVLVQLALPETHGPERRRQTQAGGRLLETYGRILTDGRFLTAVLTAGCTQAALLAYIAGSSSTLITLFGLTPFAYGLLFAVNAAGLIGGAQMNGMLIERHGAPRLIGTAVASLLATTALLAVLTLAGVATLVPTVVLLFLSLAVMGFIMPPATMLALEPFGVHAGTASALSGALQFTVSTLAIFLVGSGFDGTARPMALGLFGGALLAFLSWRLHLLAAGRASACRAD